MTSQALLENLLSTIHLPLPTAENRHLALRFLLDAEYHARQSLPPDSPFLKGLGNHNVTPLYIGKCILTRILHPAWHPILHEYEHRILTDVSQIYYQTSPQSSSPKVEYPPSCSGSGSSSSTSSPCSEFAFSSPNPSLVPPECNEFDEEPELKYPSIQSNNSMRPDLELSEDPYMYELEAITATAETSCITSFKEVTGSTSTYSALLPERHCPPFIDTAKMAPDTTAAYQDTMLCNTKESLSVDIPNHASLLPSSMHNLPLPSTEAASPEINTRADEPLYPQGSLREQNAAWPSGDDPIGETEGPYSTKLATDGSICTSSLTFLTPKTSFPERFDTSNHGSCSSGPEEHNLDTRSHRKKRKKRALDRPPGLPLGPWTPNDTSPLPSVIPPRKPRRVRQAPLRASAPIAPQGRAKVSCPECSSLLRPKSLSRHLERHSNWTKGKYNAHLCCRYCLASYSRMDSLIHHQKTDAGCVQMQYDIYTSEQGTYSEGPCRVRMA